MSDERRERREREEHDETQEVVGLVRHPVDDAAVHQRKDDLQDHTAPIIHLLHTCINYT